MGKIDLKQFEIDYRKEIAEEQAYIKTHSEEYKGIDVIFPSTITIEGVTICMD